MGDSLSGSVSLGAGMDTVEHAGYFDFTVKDISDPAFQAECQKLFTEADPFPHIVIDGLFDAAFLRRVCCEFDSPNRQGRAAHTSREKTWRSKDPAAFGRATQAYFDRMHRHDMVRFLSSVSGVTPLIVDHELLGGGMHECADGGFFDIHRDFNQHRETALDNAMVVITYLNDDWLSAWGGALELWCPRRKKIIQSIAPIIGRTVILRHTRESYHGHTQTVATDGHSCRRSLATYYYTRRLGILEKSDHHSSLFAMTKTGKFAPTEYPEALSSGSFRARAHRICRISTPPFIWELVRKWAGQS